MRGAFGGGDRLLAHHLGQNPAGLLACGGNDVHPLEVVAVARVALDLRLGGRAGERQSSLHLAGLIAELHQLADLAEVGQVLGAEIEHRDLVAKDPGAGVDDDIPAGLGGGHRREPLEGFRLVELDAEAAGGFDDSGNFGRGRRGLRLCHRCHS